MKRGLLIGLVAVVFVWTLLVHAPAALVYGWIKARVAAVELYGVDGQLGSGTAEGFSVNGRTIDERVKWDFQPWWLPLGRVAFHVEGTGLSQLNGGIQVGLGGLRLRGLQGNSDIKGLAGLVGYGFTPVNGAAQVDIALLQLKNGAPVAANGTVDVHGLSWALSQNPVALGDFRATATTESDMIVIKIESPSGPLETSGDIKLTTKDNRYDVDLQLKPKGNPDPVLRNLLESLGPTDPKGFYHLRRGGTLP
jgi:hypothetical protein